MRELVIKVFVDEGEKERYQAAADSRGWPLSLWMREAANSYAAKGEAFDKYKGKKKEYASGWPKNQPCFYCEGKHDPLEAHPGLMKADVKYALRALSGGE